MARPLRIEFEYAWYYVMNRGRGRHRVFHRKTDYEFFIKLLQDTSERWKLRVAGYCLMPNHYHLLVQTPLGNLSRCMRQIDGVYTQLYNRLRKTDGSIFRGRYKSILIDEENYLLHLLRYIHLNPVKARLVKSMDDYPWSSHKGYLSRAKKWAWIYKEKAFAGITTFKSHQIRIYREYMSIKTMDQKIAVLDKKRWPAILGSDEFKQKIKSEKWFKVDRDIPQSRDFSISIEDIKRTVCTVYDVDESHFLKSRRGEFNEPRNMAIYLSRRLCPDTLTQIGKHFAISNYSSVSSASDRMARTIESNRKIRITLKKLISELGKSQGEI